MSELRKQIEDKINEYLADEQKFEEKGVDAAGKRARAALHEISTLAKARRAEIQEIRNNKKEK